MAEDKKRDTDHKTLNEEVRKRDQSVEYAELVRRQEITNTYPAPRNPNRDEGSSKKDD